MPLVLLTDDASLGNTLEALHARRARAAEGDGPHGHEHDQHAIHCASMIINEAAPDAGPLFFYAFSCGRRTQPNLRAFPVLCLLLRFGLLFHGAFPCGWPSTRSKGWRLADERGVNRLWRHRRQELAKCQRVSIRRFRLTLHPAPSSPRRNAASRVYRRAASVQAAARARRMGKAVAETPNSPRKSRRRIAFLKA